MYRTLRAAMITAVATLSLAAPASAQEGCLGLECPGGVPESSQARGMLLSVDEPLALGKVETSGFYEFGQNNEAVGRRAVAYVAKPGTLDQAPAEVRALPSAASVTAEEAERNTIIVFGAKVLAQAPPDAATAGKRGERGSKRGGPRARAAAQWDCPSGWFCLWSDYEYYGWRGQWQDTGFWQDLSQWGFQNLMSSMYNRRSGAALVAPGTGGGGSRYCAQPNSADTDLSNNGSINNNSESVYLSTAGNYHAGWNCFNPY